jgi:hypothetical protein
MRWFDAVRRDHETDQAWNGVPPGKILPEPNKIGAPNPAPSATVIRK